MKCKMIKKLIFYENNDAYFYYGVFTKQDYKNVASTIEFFNTNMKNIHPTYEKFYYFSKVIKLIDDDNINERNNL